MGARRYGPSDGQPVPFEAYHQSRHELEGLPHTVSEKIPVTNSPNIFSYRSYVFAKNPALVRRFIKATKADVGGVGGHVVAADEVKSVIAKYVLDNNGYRGEPIFTSLIVTHTGDDCAVTGIMAETVDMSVVDELMWDALQEGAHKAAELGLYGPGQDLVADAKKHLDEEVSEGHLTQAQADQMLSRLEDGIRAMVSHTLPHGMPGPGFGFRHGFDGGSSEGPPSFDGAAA